MRDWREARAHASPLAPCGMSGRAETRVSTGDPGVAELAVDAPVLVDGLEVAREMAGALARTEEEHPAAVEREVEERERLLLGGRLEVDEEVPAADEVDARERRVA